MKKLVGYGFSLPLKPSLFNIGSFDLLGFLFDGRLKPYPTEIYVIEGKEKGRSPVGGDCYHTILNLIFKINFYIHYLLVAGAMAIAPYGCFKIQKYDNLPYFSHKLCFNVKIPQKL